ncbi:MAG TPA: ABC transporter permease [Gammaproteobacteria bacterium]|nr:ABC transporter permease [Gammaproteobacteria bacterium]
MSAFRQDLRYALRTLRSTPGFAAMAIATIALSIGANTAMFSFLNGVLLQPLPYPNPERVMLVLEKRPDGGTNGISTLNYLDWARQQTVFQYLAAQTGWGATYTGGDEPVRLTGGQVTVQYFDITGAQLLLGRKFLPGEDEVGNNHVVLLSNGLWQTRFGGDPAIVGKSIVLDGEPHTVVGVLAGGGTFDRQPRQIWRPLAFQPENMTRDFHWFGALGTLKAGVTLEQARASMDVIGKQISDAYPASNKGWGVSVQPLAEQMVGGETRTAVIALFGATAFVLLIGCANLANLALARGLARRREIAVRASLGAGRLRLARQFLTENMLLSVCGGVLGVGVGYATMRGIKAMIPPFALPAEIDVRMDSNVLLFAGAVTILTGILFGLAPAIQATRTNLTEPMKEGGQGTTPTGGGARLRSTLVVAEMALAFVLLVGSGLLLRSLFGLLAVDPGFDATNVLTANLPIANAQHPDPKELNRYLQSVREAVAAVPGVRETALTSALPLQGWGYGMPYEIAGRPPIEPGKRGGMFFKMVTPSYFEALHIDVIAGRALRDTDVAGSPPVTMINETFAKRDFKNENPIGQRILVQEIVPGKTALGPEVTWEIVGVIKDEKISSLDDTRSSGMYVTMEQSPVYFASLIARAAVDPQTLEKSVRAAVASVSKDQPLADVRTLEQIADQSLVGDRIQAILLAVFAAMALLLAAVGIYGVIAYAVTQRTHELGIRSALGASGRSLRALVFVSGMKLAGLGLAIGLAASLVVGKLLDALLFGVGARDPLTLAAVAAVLTAVAAAACFVPARRATNVDPIVALRYQ